jgi:pyruvate formate lyase activating enzyme
MQAILFNLQKFCIHDGPGIRTTVFFKGCPLSCKWCANPESQAVQAEITRDFEKCVHCFACTRVCEGQAMESDLKNIRYHRGKCTYCTQCVRACPTGALELCGKRYTLEAVFKEVCKDKNFYEDSGGGVTFSGGEFLLQPDFSVALAKELHKEGIHVAGETCGFVATEIFARVLPYIDLVLFDMKHYDRVKHYESTGAYPELIWKNLKLVLNSNQQLLVRIPVIPGINDSLSDAAGFVAKLQKFKQTRVQLLVFHQLGQKKYDMLGKPYKFSDVAQLQKVDLIEYQSVFQKNGIQTFFE